MVERQSSATRFGLLRLVHDVLHTSGYVEVNCKSKRVVSIALNRAAPWARMFIEAWTDIFSTREEVLILCES